MNKLTTKRYPIYISPKKRVCCGPEFLLNPAVAANVKQRRSKEEDSTAGRDRGVIMMDKEQVEYRRKK